MRTRNPDALLRRTRASALAVSRRSPASARDAAERAASKGWTIIALFFGLLGSWAVFAPLNSAVVAEAVVKVEGNRKSIQHLEGGIVREVLVKDGEMVEAGAPLVVLDATQAQAEVEVLDQLAVALRLTEARLNAEQEENGELTLPSQLAGRTGEAPVMAAFRSQAAQFDARKRELEGQIALIAQRIAQIEAQMAGSRSQLESLRLQRTSLADELDSLKPLLDKGIVTRQRLLQLERSVAALDGQIGEVTAAIARGEQAEGEQRQLEAQTRNSRRAAVAQELRDVQMRLAEILPKLSNAEFVKARTVVKAPYAGRVVGLNVFAVGAVIGRGERLLDIVPEQGALVIEARIPVQDIAEIGLDQEAEVRLTGFKQMASRAVKGAIVNLSADRLTDERSGAPYYAASIRISDGDLATFPEIRLHPGMAATVVIPTAPRSVLQYLVGPLMTSFDGALREK